MGFEFGEVNEAQKQAIITTEGPLLIIAGPGTGKTSTLVKRIRYLISEKNVSPKEIMVATFTEKAAKEIMTRISSELIKTNPDVNLNDMYIGTFHSICIRLLEENLEFTSLQKGYTLVDDFEQQNLIFENLGLFRDQIANYKEMFVNLYTWTGKIKGERNQWDQAGILMKTVNQYREELVDLQAMLRDSDKQILAVAKAMKIYEELLAKRNIVDFCRMQCETYNLFLKHPQIQKQVTDQIHYIMIDEYQDTNYIQEQIVLLLRGENDNICVVGDDDQGIYRFRGATISNILHFPSYFHGKCKQIYLTINYRSQKDIITLYNDWMDDQKGYARRFLSWDGARYQKEIEPSSNHQVEKLSVVTCSPNKLTNGTANQKKNERMLQLIQKLKQEKVITNYNQIAILSRATSGYESLISYLEQNEVPVYAPRFNMFFYREEVQLMLGVLVNALGYTLDKEGENGRIPQMDSYYSKCYERLLKYLEKEGEELRAWMTYTSQLLSEESVEKNFTYTTLCYQMLEFEPFHSYVNIEMGKGVKAESKARNIAKLIEIIALFEKINQIENLPKSREAFEKKTISFLQYYMYRQFSSRKITEYEDDTEYAPSGCVSLMTIHQSKGMEFPVVIVDLPEVKYWFPQEDLYKKMQDGYFQRDFSVEKRDDIPYYDFWRLYYVAFSRAQNLLVLWNDFVPATQCIPVYLTDEDGHMLTVENEKGRESQPFEELLYERNYPEFDQVDFSSIASSQVKNNDLKRTFSFTSHISCYEDCSVRYKYLKELDFKPTAKAIGMEFGTLVHETIEDVNKTAIKGCVQDITDENIKHWVDKNYAALSQQSGSVLMPSMKPEIIKQVKNYVLYNQGKWDKLREAEVELSLVRDRYILKGKIDLIQGEDDTYELLDFKTGKKPKKDSRLLAHYKDQLITYAYLIKERYQKKVSGAHLYYTSDETGNPLISFSITDAQLKLASEHFDKVVQQIMENQYDTYATDCSICEKCDMRFYCHVQEESPNYEKDKAYYDSIKNALQMLAASKQAWEEREYQIVDGQIQFESISTKGGKIAADFRGIPYTTEQIKKLLMHEVVDGIQITEEKGAKSMVSLSLNMDENEVQICGRKPLCICNKADSINPKYGTRFYHKYGECEWLQNAYRKDIAISTEEEAKNMGFSRCCWKCSQMN